MDSALIVSSSDKGNDFFVSMLRQIFCSKVTTVKTCGETRRFMMERDFDLYIINSPLTDETGENLSIHIATRSSSQVILVVKAELYDVISSKVEDYGVITIAKPINRHMFWTALKLAKASGNRLKMLKSENTKLTKKIDDIKIVDRAKYLLISYLNMTEPQAHKYIEKQAMDLRVSKRKIAEKILRTYEN
ncbi:MAG: ANTAR domain-containing protein [Clostridia bacterium]